MRGRCAISIKILVDDEDFISKKTLETLTDDGCVCIGASDVKTTVELVSTAAAVIFVVFDLNTPNKTGSDLIKAVKTREGQKIKFIVVLQNATPKVEGNGIDIASYPFLKISLDIDGLIDTVASVLEARE
jgi:DNA-binding NtrC family response regulator